MFIELQVISHKRVHKSPTNVRHKEVGPNKISVYDGTT